jgi:hypothetical protein
MRALLEEMTGRRLYVFTTQGHIYAGVLESVLEEVIQLIAANGHTRMHVSVSDVSGVRPYDEEPDEGRP